MANSKLSILFLFALFGLVAAFFRPAVPHQVKPTEIPRGGDVKAAFVDAGLDNPLIENDEGIEASRKCGFCMGVSILGDIIHRKKIFSMFRIQEMY